jgi:hypothetical protein
MTTRLWLLISDTADNTLRVARSGNPLGTYGQTEICLHYSETKAGMIRHLESLGKGGFRVAHMIAEINATR